MSSRASKTAAWLSVVSAYQVCEDRYARLLEHFGLSTAQFEVLNALHELGGAAQPTHIAERLLVTKGNVTGLLSRLGEAGWVRVGPHPSDGRSRLCELTPRARELVAKARRAAGRFIDAQCAPFSAAELAAVEDVMRRMQAHLERLDVGALARAAGDAEAPAERGGR
jgi:DNA-binding MarR family transcriptional regulator